MKQFGNTNESVEYGTPGPDPKEVSGVVVVAFDPRTSQWMGLKWKDTGTIWLVGGGNEDGEDFADAAVRELAEETGYTSFEEQIQLGGTFISYYYNERKDSHRRSTSRAYLFLLDGSAQGEQALEGHEDFDVVWMDYPELVASITETGGGVEHWLAVLKLGSEYVEAIQR